MRKFKISCHAIAKIMTGSIGITDIQKARIEELETRKKDAAAGVPKVKPLTPNMEAELLDLINKRENPQLPQGARTYLKTWIKRKLFDRKEDWKAIVVEKGLACEQEGIDLVSRVYGIPDLEKNTEFFDHHEYIYGSPDILPETDEAVRDIKNSWDLFTFPMFEKDMPDEDYWWQMQGYMILTDRRRAVIDYTLIDTPVPLMLQDINKVKFQSGGKAEDWTVEKYESLYPNYQFKDIPEKLRVKSFYVGFDPTAEQKIIERVKMCREYIKTIATEEIINSVEQAA